MSVTTGKRQSEIDQILQLKYSYKVKTDKGLAKQLSINPVKTGMYIKT